jgi:hypothetical protein
VRLRMRKEMRSGGADILQGRDGFLMFQNRTKKEEEQTDCTPCNQAIRAREGQRTSATQLNSPGLLCRLTTDSRSRDGILHWTRVGLRFVA